jgi:propanol-preferring alcohol dehydrogenase
MRAMVLDHAKTPLRLDEHFPDPKPSPGQVLIRIAACGVCRTDLHVFDGELPEPKLPLVLGHQIVGTVTSLGPDVDHFDEGDRIGVPWLGWTDGTCRYCKSGRENLCDRARFTGYTINGGYAEYAIADARYCFPIPPQFGDAEAAPLLCAGLIGYRALRLAGDAQTIGFYGFGSSAHILIQVARHRGQRVFAFTRPGDARGQDFARSLGAVWAGDSTSAPPERLDAAIIFAAVGSLVPAALAVVHKGGVVVCAGIHMSDIPSFSYDLLWEERMIRSVANLTRADAEEFLPLAAQVPVRTTITKLPLEEANDALERLRAGDTPGGSLVLFLNSPKAFIVCHPESLKGCSPSRTALGFSSGANVSRTEVRPSLLSSRASKAR